MTATPDQRPTIEELTRSIVDLLGSLDPAVRRDLMAFVGASPTAYHHPRPILHNGRKPR